MGLFDIFKRKEPPPAKLPEALIEAAHREDSDEFARLCTEHRDEIYRLLPEWSSVSRESLRDPAALERYAKGLIAIAQFFESAGDSSLLDSLKGDEASNPITLWQRDLSEAREMIDSGRAAEAVTLLHSVLERTNGVHGQAADKFKPMTLGWLGAAYARVNDKERALEFLQKALEMCRSVGDDEGARTYAANIDHIQNAG